jgi:hypothetical protein
MTSHGHKVTIIAGRKQKIVTSAACWNGTVAGASASITLILEICFSIPREFVGRRDGMHEKQLFALFILARREKNELIGRR